MSVYVYIRVSTIDQQKEGYSLGAQEHKAKHYWMHYAKINNLDPEITEVFVDTASARRHRLIDRPAGGKLNGLLRTGDHVIFLRMDRAFRIVRDQLNTLHDWEERGVIVHFTDLHFDTSTSLGKFFLTVLALIAQMESDRISERTKEGMEELKRHKLRVSRDPKIGQGLIPYDGPVKKLRGKWKVVDDLWEIILVKLIVCYKLDCNGTLSWLKISDRIEAADARMHEREPLPDPTKKFSGEVRRWSFNRCRISFLGQKEWIQKNPGKRYWQEIVGRVDKPKPKKKKGA